jgi:hypothetical protein
MTLASAPSHVKKQARKFVHRRSRRATKLALRVTLDGLERDWDGLLFPDVEAGLSGSERCLT